MCNVFYNEFYYTCKRPTMKSLTVQIQMQIDHIYVKKCLVFHRQDGVLIYECLHSGTFTQVNAYLIHYHTITNTGSEKQTLNF